jgi:hypothetical protein
MKTERHVIKLPSGRTAAEQKTLREILRLFWFNALSPYETITDFGYSRF